MIFLPWPRLYLLLTTKWSPADIDTIDTDKRQIDCVLWLVRTCPLRPLIGCQGSFWACHQASQAHLHSHPDKWCRCRDWGWYRPSDLSLASSAKFWPKIGQIKTSQYYLLSMISTRNLILFTPLDKLWSLLVRKLHRLVQSLKYTATVIPCFKGLWNIKLVLKVSCLLRRASINNQHKQLQYTWTSLN